MSWRILWQSERNTITQCKRLSIVSEDKRTGELSFMRPKLWEIWITNSSSQPLKLVIRLKLNELMQPTFTIQHPKKEVHPTIQRNGREIPIHGDMIVVNGESERYYEVNGLRDRLAGFTGFPLANEIVSLFRIQTPLT